MESTAQAKPKVKYKTFRYHTRLKWLGNRAGMLQSEGKPEFRVASPPEFKGEEGVWTPEDLFVASVEVCTMTTFLAFSQKLKLPIVSYSSRAEGVLEFVDGGYQFTKIILRPTIVVENEGAIEQTRKTLHDAHKRCLVSNSIKAEVMMEPVVRTSENNGTANSENGHD
ncbi:OsmC family peroxiredoxin [candidate division KSB1 bacterium]|nr:OsmC family peroxiredoxin [candidate division KSB1 bacterium]NIR73418.1 OsmC family peroxiredoxin [candidate division KSB1 bacterium]NIS28409.1 OsmC family peroxiredoxin [candidate division KSB1 bacterium]NIT75289.1 OsmC family peroxiredoxin [candidate division KSB1 bacterium]NIU29137.1 OsmC family peroxiredoxin [candidate division KSB1 bacterium]